MSEQHEPSIYPVRLEIRRNPEQPQRSTHFINGRPVSSRAYTELARDLCYRVAREQSVLILVESLPPGEAEEPRSPSAPILAFPGAPTPGQITVQTEDLSLSLIPPLLSDLNCLQRERLERYRQHHRPRPSQEEEHEEDGGLLS
jgi:hypothetical protein